MIKKLTDEQMLEVKAIYEGVMGSTQEINVEEVEKAVQIIYKRTMGIKYTAPKIVILDSITHFKKETDGDIEDLILKPGYLTISIITANFTSEKPSPLLSAYIDLAKNSTGIAPCQDTVYVIRNPAKLSVKEDKLYMEWVDGTYDTLEKDGGVRK